MWISFKRIAAAFVALGIAIAFTAGSAGSQSLVTLHLASPGGDDDTPVLYALQAGLFRRAGLNVDLQRVPSGAAAAAAVVGGAIQIGYASMMPLLSAHQRNVPLQLIAPGSIYTTEHPTQLMLVLKDAPIHSGHDLNGKIVASPALKDLISTANLSWIDANGGDSKSVKQVEIPQAAAIAAMEVGRIDATTLIEPRASEALATGKFRVLGKSFDGIAKRFMGAAWFADAGYANANADTMLRFARVMRDASIYANAHPSETAPILADAMKVDVAAITHSTRLIFEESMLIADIQPIIDASAKYGVIDRSFPAQELVSPIVRTGGQP